MRAESRAEREPGQHPGAAQTRSGCTRRSVLSGSPTVSGSSPTRTPASGRVKSARHPRATDVLASDAPGFGLGERGDAVTAERHAGRVLRWGAFFTSTLEAGMTTRPNIIVIVIDDLRWDELGVTGHPYMKTPHIDRLAREGARFTHAFHTTPLCSPNRASILTGQYASRHGIIDNVGRDVASHRLPTYPRGAPEGRLRDRARRQVAHGERRLAPARQRLLGQLSRPGQAGRSRAPGERPAPRRARLRHRPPERAGPRVRGAPAPAAVRPVPGAQGRAPGRVPAPGRHHRPRLARRLRAGGAAPRPLSRPGVPAAAERPAAGGRRPRPSRRWPRRSPGRSGSPRGARCSPRFMREARRRSASARR